MRRKIELFFRGESWLHYATMFFCQAIFMHFLFNLPLLIYILLPIVVGISWEIFWNRVRKSPIDIWDITWTVLGGLSYLLLTKI